ncbi:hypothetical protein STENM327S_03820 [Streptomyces tendae]
MLHATWLGLTLGLLIPQLFGTFTAYAARAALDYAGPLVDAAPTWYLVPLLLAASAGSVGNAGLMLYSMGLACTSSCRAPPVPAPPAPSPSSPRPASSPGTTPGRRSRR